MSPTSHTSATTPSKGYRQIDHEELRIVAISEWLLHFDPRGHGDGVGNATATSTALQVQRADASIVASDVTLCIQNTSLFSGHAIDVCLATQAERDCLGAHPFNLDRVSGLPPHVMEAYNRAIVARMSDEAYEAGEVCSVEMLLDADFVTNMELDSEALLALTHALSGRAPHGDLDRLAGVSDALISSAEANYARLCRLANGEVAAPCSVANFLSLPGPKMLREQLANPYVNELCSAAQDAAAMFEVLHQGPASPMSLFAGRLGERANHHERWRAKVEREAKICRTATERSRWGTKAKG